MLSNILIFLISVVNVFLTLLVLPLALTALLITVLILPIDDLRQRLKIKKIVIQIKSTKPKKEFKA